MKGNFELKKQINGIGLFCIIELEIKKSKDNSLNISFDVPDINYFETSIKHGIHLALENLIIKGFNQNRNYNIKVTKFSWMDVDTSLSCVSYTSCRAIYNAFGCESKLPKPRINESGDFVF